MLMGLGEVSELSSRGEYHCTERIYESRVDIKEFLLSQRKTN